MNNKPNKFGQSKQVNEGTQMQEDHSLKDDTLNQSVQSFSQQQISVQKQDQICEETQMGLGNQNMFQSQMTEMKWGKIDDETQMEKGSQIMFQQQDPMIKHEKISNGTQIGKGNQSMFQSQMSLIKKVQIDEETQMKNGNQPVSLLDDLSNCQQQTKQNNASKQYYKVMESSLIDQTLQANHNQMDQSQMFKEKEQSNLQIFIGMEQSQIEQTVMTDNMMKKNDQSNSDMEKTVVEITNKNYEDGKKAQKVNMLNQSIEKQTYQLVQVESAPQVIQENKVQVKGDDDDEFEKTEYQTFSPGIVQYTDQTNTKIKEKFYILSKQDIIPSPYVNMMTMNASNASNEQSPSFFSGNQNALNQQDQFNSKHVVEEEKKQMNELAKEQSFPSHDLIVNQSEDSDNTNSVFSKNKSFQKVKKQISINNIESLSQSKQDDQIQSSNSSDNSLLYSDPDLEQSHQDYLKMINKESYFQKQQSFAEKNKTEELIAKQLAELELQIQKNAEYKMAAGIQAKKQVEAQKQEKLKELQDQIYTMNQKKKQKAEEARLSKEAKEQEEAIKAEEASLAQIAKDKEIRIQKEKARLLAYEEEQRKIKENQEEEAQRQERLRKQQKIKQQQASKEAREAEAKAIKERKEEVIQAQNEHIKKQKEARKKQKQENDAAADLLLNQQQEAKMKEKLKIQQEIDDQQKVINQIEIQSNQQQEQLQQNDQKEEEKTPETDYDAMIPSSSELSFSPDIDYDSPEYQIWLINQQIEQEKIEKLIYDQKHKKILEEQQKYDAFQKILKEKKEELEKMRKEKVESKQKVDQLQKEAEEAGLKGKSYDQVKNYDIHELQNYQKQKQLQKDLEKQKESQQNQNPPPQPQEISQKNHKEYLLQKQKEAEMNLTNELKEAQELEAKQIQEQKEQVIKAKMLQDYKIQEQKKNAEREQYNKQKQIIKKQNHQNMLNSLNQEQLQKKQEREADVARLNAKKDKELADKKEKESFLEDSRIQKENVANQIKKLNEQIARQKAESVKKQQNEADLKEALRVQKEYEIQQKNKKIILAKHKKAKELEDKEKQQLLKELEQKAKIANDLKDKEEQQLLEEKARQEEKQKKNEERLLDLQQMKENSQVLFEQIIKQTKFQEEEIQNEIKNQEKLAETQDFKCEQEKERFQAENRIKIKLVEKKLLNKQKDLINLNEYKQELIDKKNKIDAEINQIKEGMDEISKKIQFEEKKISMDDSVVNLEPQELDNAQFLDFKNYNQNQVQSSFQQLKNKSQLQINLNSFQSQFKFYKVLTRQVWHLQPQQMIEKKIDFITNQGIYRIENPDPKVPVGANPKLMQLIFQYLHIDEIRNLSIANKFVYGCLVDLVSRESNLPDKNTIFPDGVPTFRETFRELVKYAKMSLDVNEQFKISDGYQILKRTNNTTKSAVLYSLFCTNLQTPKYYGLNYVQQSKLNQEDELNESIWLMDQKEVRQLMKFKKQNHDVQMVFLPKKNDLDTLNPLRFFKKQAIIETLTWSINSRLDLEIKSKQGELIYQSKQTNSQIEKINNYYLIEKKGSSLPGHAYLLSAPNSITYGSNEPRAYIDVDQKTNYSTFNSNGKDQDDFIKTSFNKVRLVSYKNKKGEMVDKIDLSDYRFAESNRAFKIEPIAQGICLIDAAPYAVAMNTNTMHSSQFKVDIRSQPFSFKFQDWGKFGDQAVFQSQQKNASAQTAWYVGCGSIGGCAPKIDLDQVQDMQSYFSQSLRFMWAKNDHQSFLKLKFRQSENIIKQ